MIGRRSATVVLLRPVEPRIGQTRQTAPCVLEVHSECSNKSSCGSIIFRSHFGKMKLNN